MASNGSLRIGVIFDPLMATACALDPRCPSRGAAIDATLIVCQYLNVSCNFFWASDPNDYGRLVNGSWTGVIGDLVDGRFDTGIPYVFPTPERSLAADFSSAFFVVDQVFVTRMPVRNRLPDLDFSVVFAFNWAVWFCILLSCFTIGFLISAFEAERIRIRTQFLSKAYFKAFKYLSGNGDPYRPYNRCGSNLLFTWWGLTCIVLSGAYTGSMFYRRISARTDYPFTDMSTFVQCIGTGRCRFITSPRQDYLLDRLVSSKNEDSDSLARAFAVYPPLVVGDEKELWRIILNDTSVYWTTLDVRPYFYAFTDYNAFCAYHVVQAPFRDIAAFPLPKHSPLRHQLDAAARLFRDNGLSIALTKKYQRTADQCQLTPTSKTGDVVPLHSVRSYFILYGCGITMAVSVLALEIWHQMRRRRRVWSRGDIKQEILRIVRLGSILVKTD